MSITGKKIEKLGDNIQDSLFEFAEFNNKEAEAAGYSNYSYWKSTWNSFINNKVALFLLILVIAILAFTAFFMMLYDLSKHKTTFNDFFSRKIHPALIVLIVVYLIFNEFFNIYKGL